MPSAIRPSAAICSVKKPSDVQVWECATASVATPFSRAAASASGSARAKAGWAKPNRASTRTQPGAGRTRSGSHRPSTRPLQAARSRIRGSRARRSRCRFPRRAPRRGPRPPPANPPPHGPEAPARTRSKISATLTCMSLGPSVGRCVGGTRPARPGGGGSGTSVRRQAFKHGPSRTRGRPGCANRVGPRGAWAVRGGFQRHPAAISASHSPCAPRRRACIDDRARPSGAYGPCPVPARTGSGARPATAVRPPALRHRVVGEGQPVGQRRHGTHTRIAPPSAPRAPGSSSRARTRTPGRSWLSRTRAPAPPLPPCPSHGPPRAPPWSPWPGFQTGCARPRIIRRPPCRSAPAMVQPCVLRHVVELIGIGRAAIHGDAQPAVRARIEIRRPEKGELAAQHVDGPHLRGQEVVADFPVGRVRSPCTRRTIRRCSGRDMRKSATLGSGSCRCRSACSATAARAMSSGCSRWAPGSCPRSPRRGSSLASDTYQNRAEPRRREIGIERPGEPVFAEAADSSDSGMRPSMRKPLSSSAPIVSARSSTSVAVGLQIRAAQISCPSSDSSASLQRISASHGSRPVQRPACHVIAEANEVMAQGRSHAADCTGSVAAPARPPPLRHGERGGEVIAPARRGQWAARGPERSPSPAR
jgi:hypothetical protein